MELKQYLHIILKWKSVVIYTAIGLTVLVLIFSFVEKPVYEATAKLLIEERGSNSSLLNELAAESALTALSRTGNPLDNQIEILKTDPILLQVIQMLNLKDPKGEPLSTAGLRKKINVFSLRLTDIICISAQSTDPHEAALIANALSEIFVRETQKYSQREAGLAREFIEKQLIGVQRELSGAELAPGKGVNVLQEKRMATVTERTYIMLLEKLEEARIAEAVKMGYARVIEPAAIPLNPIKPKKALNVSLGAIFGVLFGMSLAFLFEYFDDSVKSSDDVRSLLDLPILGVIPNFDHEKIGHVGKDNNWRKALFDHLSGGFAKVMEFKIFSKIRGIRHDN